MDPPGAMPPGPSGTVEERKPKKPRSSKSRTFLQNKTQVEPKDSRPAHSLQNECSAPSTVLAIAARQSLREIHARPNQYCIRLETSKNYMFPKCSKHIQYILYNIYFMSWRNTWNACTWGVIEKSDNTSRNRFTSNPHGSISQLGSDRDLVNVSHCLRTASYGCQCHLPRKLRTVRKFKHVPTLTLFSHTVQSIQKVSTAKAYSKNWCKNNWTSDVGMIAYFIVFHSAFGHVTYIKNNNTRQYEVLSLWHCNHGSALHLFILGKVRDERKGHTIPLHDLRDKGFVLHGQQVSKDRTKLTNASILVNKGVVYIYIYIYHIYIYMYVYIIYI